MKESPLVSVITPLYNRIDLISEMIDSVIQQTYENWELIIVDDESTDGSYEYVQSRAEQDSRILLFPRDREPKGASTCRNIALKQASGSYIIFLDSDDLLAPHCLEQRTIMFAQNSGYDFLVFPIQYFENYVGDRQDIFFRKFDNDYLTSFLLKSYWITMSTIWKKKSVDKLGGFDEQLACMQDSDLHMRAMIAGQTYRVFQEKNLTDGYLRVSDSHARISNNISVTKLDSKVRANQKLYKLLQKKKMLTPLRQRMIAANYLNISWNYQLIGEKEKARQLWKTTHQAGMISNISYLLGISFTSIRSWPIIRYSRILAGVIKRVHQLFLPKFLLYL